MKTRIPSGRMTRRLDMPLAQTAIALDDLLSNGPVTFGADDSSLLVYPDRFGEPDGHLRMHASLYVDQPWPRWFAAELTVEGAKHSSLLGLRLFAKTPRRRPNQVFAEAALETLAALAAAVERHATPRPQPAASLPRMTGVPPSRGGRPRAA